MRVPVEQVNVIACADRKESSLQFDSTQLSGSHRKLHLPNRIGGITTKRHDKLGPGYPDTIEQRLIKVPDGRTFNEGPDFRTDQSGWSQFRRIIFLSKGNPLVTDVREPVSRVDAICVGGYIGHLESLSQHQPGTHLGAWQTSILFHAPINREAGHVHPEGERLTPIPVPGASIQTLDPHERTSSSSGACRRCLDATTERIA